MKQKCMKKVFILFLMIFSFAKIESRKFLWIKLENLRPKFIITNEIILNINQGIQKATLYSVGNAVFLFIGSNIYI